MINNIKGERSEPLYIIYYRCTGFYIYKSYKPEIIFYHFFHLFLLTIKALYDILSTGGNLSFNEMERNGR